jgi:hypothetical protein
MPSTGQKKQLAKVIRQPFTIWLASRSDVYACILGPSITPPMVGGRRRLARLSMFVCCTWLCGCLYTVITSAAPYTDACLLLLLPPSMCVCVGGCVRVASSARLSASARIAGSSLLSTLHSFFFFYQRVIAEGAKEKR